MSSDEPHWRGIGGLVATVGVILSLIFVGMELRQNTVVSRAQARQGLADRNADVINSIAENPELARAWGIMWRGRVDSIPLTHADSTQANWAMFGMLRHVENVYLQYLEGVVDESVLDSYGFEGNNNFEGDQFPDWWASRRHRFDARFVEEFEAEYGLR